MATTTNRPVGRMLAQWRQTRRLSQLALAANARVSARHLSFVESGRAAPSRDMIMTLAAALDVPLRDRNQLLLAGGFAPMYRETALAEPGMAPVRDALQRFCVTTSRTRPWSWTGTGTCSPPTIPPPRCSSSCYRAQQKTPTWSG